MTQYIPQCMLCKHFNGDDTTKESCTAFPEGIPDAIIKNDLRHDKPVEGDHGVQFKPVDEDARRVFIRLFPTNT